MSSRLAFQTQLASIMEVLANAAVAEICKLVDDDYAVVRLQMSQCQRENKALKRKLHLLELKMARGNAERRLRESALSSSRPRVHVSADDRLREPPPAGGVYERQIDVALWSSRASAEDAASQPLRSDSVQSKSPDVELVEPEAVLVKEEKMESNMSRAEEVENDVALIGDDGVLECVPRGLTGQRANEQQGNQMQTGRARRPSSRSSRGVEREEEPDVVLVKVEEMESVRAAQNETGLSIQEGLVESSTDDYRGVLPFEESTQSSSQRCDLQDPSRAFSEPAAGISEESSSASVQLGTADSNSPANPKTQEQQGCGNLNPLTSEYSLFELETFFTRWAPGDASAPSEPSCSFATDDSAKCNKDGVVLAQTERCLSSAARRSTAEALSRPLRMQAPSAPSDPSPWRRTQGRMSAPSQRDHSSAAVTHSDGGDSAPALSLPCRKMNSGVAPPLGFGVALSAQHRATLLARHNKSHAVSTMPNERRRKSYACQACGKAFSGLSNLEAHERVHTGEKPFRCDTCGKHFSEAGNLKKHQRVHTGEKPFSCDQCGKRFAWICNLRTHQQSATGCVPPARGGSGLG